MTSSQPTLVIDQGTYAGTIEAGGVRAFRGIPYAALKRFERPQVHNASNPDPRGTGGRVIDATKRGVICPQLPSRLESVTGPIPPNSGVPSEDCGQLSIFLPKIDAKSQGNGVYAIMATVHGGAFWTGSSQIGWYEGIGLAQEGVIVISISYRLGAFGFLYDEERLAQTGGLDLGVLDYFAAIEWVHQNAPAFQGDTANVTTFGQSAGGYLQQMLLDLKPQLTKRSIVQSSPANLFRPEEVGRQIRSKFLSFLPQGVSLTNASVEEMLDAQRQMGPVAAQMGLATAFMPHTTIGPGGRGPSLAGHDILVGDTKDDAAVFVAMGQKDWGWRAGTHAVAERFRDAGAKVTQYSFEWRPEGAQFGAAHCAELPLLLGDEEAYKRAPMLGSVTYSEWHERGKSLRKAWAAFAKDGTEPQNTPEFVYGL